MGSARIDEILSHGIPGKRQETTKAETCNTYVDGARKVEIESLENAVPSLA